MPKSLRWIGVGALGVVVIAIAGVTMALGYRSAAQWRIAESARIETSNGVESLESVELGGAKQWIYLRGHDADAPVLLFVHGGPGTPEMPLARQFGRRLEQHFVVVHWDQRRSGKSSLEAAPASSLTVDQFVSDAVELIDLLRERFDEERVYLVGHSWGSVIGTLVARDHPERLHAYVGLGQVVDMRRGEEISLRFAVDRARTLGHAQALEELSGLEPPYADDLSQLAVQRKWLDRFGGVIRGGSMLPFIMQSTLSPEYSLVEAVVILSSMDDVLELMWGSIIEIDFIAQAPRLEVPVYFMMGRHDYNTPFELVEEYHAMLEAPRKEIVWFDDSAHSPNLEEPARYQAVLIEEILPETYPTSDPTTTGASRSDAGGAGPSSAGR